MLRYNRIGSLRPVRENDRRLLVEKRCLAEYDAETNPDLCQVIADCLSSDGARQTPATCAVGSLTTAGCGCATGVAGDGSTAQAVWTRTRSPGGALMSGAVTRPSLFESRKLFHSNGVHGPRSCAHHASGSCVRLVIVPGRSRTALTSEIRYSGIRRCHSSNTTSSSTRAR